MEVPKVLRLCDEFNKMGTKYIIFTIGNKSLKSYGDDLSAKALEDEPELQTWNLSRPSRPAVV